ncbi:Dynein light chain type 1 [Handroanthus impetiginosus]|uniref:Dynein light chain type 1 n=1 Tax=Handroanthus impetiginosus TaxID=429701 RepID=A0A2G9FY46_9LAMI|nr:Dynein light chain type 1 [Handroanthus impetiginosus]
MDAKATSAAKRHHHHHPPLQDPTNAPPSTVQSISNRFSKLYANHKKLVANSMEPSPGGHLHPHPQPDTHFQAKTHAFPTFSDTPSTTLTKSNSQHQRQISNDLEVVKFKNPSSKSSSFQGFDVKRASNLTSKSLESEKVKGFQKDELKKSSFQGFDVKRASNLMSKSLESGTVKGFDKLKKPLSKNSSFEGFDVKRASHLMSKSLDGEKLKGFQKDELKKPLSKNLSFKGFDVKKASHLMSKSLEKEKVKGFEQGLEVIRRPIGKGGRRMSLCSSEVELGDFFSCNGVKVVAVDMPPPMQIHAVDCARKTHDSLEKFTSKALALTLKKEFDGAYGPAWHCIVGTSFGSFVTHSVGGFLYFSMDHKLYILLFKTTVQRQE